MAGLKSNELDERLLFLQKAQKVLFNNSQVGAAILGRNLLDLLDNLTQAELGNTTHLADFFEPKRISSVSEQQHMSTPICKYCGNLLVLAATATNFRIRSTKKFLLREYNRHSRVMMVEKPCTVRSRKNLKKQKSKQSSTATKALEGNVAAEKAKRERFVQSKVKSIMDYGSRNVVTIKCKACTKTCVFPGASIYKASLIGKEQRLEQTETVKLGDRISELLEEQERLNKLSTSKQPRARTPLEIRAASLKKAKLLSLSAASTAKAQKCDNYDTNYTPTKPSSNGKWPQDEHRLELSSDLITQGQPLADSKQLSFGSENNSQKQTQRKSLSEKEGNTNSNSVKAQTAPLHIPGTAENPQTLSLKKSNSLPVTNTEAISKLSPHSTATAPSTPKNSQSNKQNFTGMPQSQTEPTKNNKTRILDSIDDKTKPDQNIKAESATGNQAQNKMKSQNLNPSQNKIQGQGQSQANLNFESSQQVSNKKRKQATQGLQALLNKKKKETQKNNNPKNAGKYSLTDFLNTL